MEDSESYDISITDYDPAPYLPYEEKETNNGIIINGDDEKENDKNKTIEEIEEQIENKYDEDEEDINDKKEVKNAKDNRMLKKYNDIIYTDKNRNEKYCCEYCDILNDYYIELSCIINIIQYFIYLGVFLLYFIDYSNFSFKRIISEEFYFFTCIGGGLIFLITKCIQCKDGTSNSFIPILFMLGLTFFKGIFFFGVWQPFYKYNDDIYDPDDNYNNNNNYNYGYKDESKLYFMFAFFFDKSQIVIIYLAYFIFSIIFYSTLALFICLKHVLNFCWFLAIGFIYIVIASLVLQFFNKNNGESNAFDLFLFILEIIFYNSGLGLSYCRGVLSHYEIAWNVLHIEIYRLYPLLALFAIPALILIALIFCFLCVCCNRLNS